jgi:hypothetical protein
MSIFTRWHDGTSLKTWILLRCHCQNINCVVHVLVVYSYVPHFCMHDNWRFTPFAENLLWWWESTVNIPQSFNYILIKIEMCSACYRFVIRRLLKLPNILYIQVVGLAGFTADCALPSVLSLHDLFVVHSVPKYSPSKEPFTFQYANRSHRSEGNGKFNMLILPYLKIYLLDVLWVSTIASALMYNNNNNK